MHNRDLSKIETLLEKNNVNTSNYLFFKNALRTYIKIINHI
jgi:hypothetical protein